MSNGYNICSHSDGVRNSLSTSFDPIVKVDTTPKTFVGGCPRESSPPDRDGYLDHLLQGQALALEHRDCSNASVDTSHLHLMERRNQDNINAVIESSKEFMPSQLNNSPTRDNGFVCNGHIWEGSNVSKP